MSEIGSIRRPGILWFRSCNNGNSVRYFMRRGMRVAHILARKLHGWLGFRTEQGEPFPAVEGCVVLCCVVLCRSIVRYSRVYTRNALRRVDFNAAQLYTQL